MGNFRVIDALATLAFDFPQAHPRAAARHGLLPRELEQFFSLCHRSGIDPLEPRGSYAGAMGLPQFMPSSWVRYATDFDGDGKIDLWNSPADAIGSVAAYFQGFGWITGMPTHYPVRFDDSRLRWTPCWRPTSCPASAWPACRAWAPCSKGRPCATPARWR
jgi:membrane-bound lytic murein transglycosylase B